MAHSREITTRCATTGNSETLVSCESPSDKGLQTDFDKRMSVAKISRGLSHG